jgi:hypothetical protein
MLRFPSPAHPAINIQRWLVACVIIMAAMLTGPAWAWPSHPVTLPHRVLQGALVTGHAPVGSTVRYAGRHLRLGTDGIFVFGVGRDAHGPLHIRVNLPDGRHILRMVRVTSRQWPTERIRGIPPKTVKPPPAIAKRIAGEQHAVAVARERDDDREDFEGGFVWPVHGRISGRFGRQRIYNGTPGAPHSGLDIAVPIGTPVHAPAGGIITLARPDLYLTGGTVLIDHGFGLSSVLLHMSKLSVTVGQHVKRGQVIGYSGMTGRATGPHVHWGVNWFNVRLDPLQLVRKRHH